MNSSITATSIVSYIEQIIQFPNFRFARGESKQYPMPFLPSVWRLGKNPNDAPIEDSSCFTIGELELLKDFQAKVISEEIVDPYFNRFIGDLENEIDLQSEHLWHWLAFAQHYGTDTRLTDVTSDAFAALFFATSANNDKDGFVYIFQDNFNIVERDNLSLVETGDTFFDINAILDDPEDKHPRQPQGDTTTVIIPSFPNRRIESQKGAFCFVKDHNIPAYWGGQLAFRIPANNKVEIVADLAKLGYTEQSLFPPKY